MINKETDASMSEQTADTNNEKTVANTEPAAEAEVTTQGIVVYTDGGCRPNPGFGGWGVHGYLYRPVSPKKASGHPDHVLTAGGYISKAESAVAMKLEGKDDRRAYDRSIEVTPVHYVDGYGSFLGTVTNNVCEIEAAWHAFRYALNYDITELQMWTDSEYVRNGLSGLASSWKANGWLRPDMTPPANVDYWKRLLEMRDRLADRGVKIKVEWIKAHSDFLGNTLVDRNATAGVMASKVGQLVGDMTIHEPEGYWKQPVERHPFIAHRRLYFNTMPEYVRAGEYFLGDNIKDDDFIGKRTSDGAYSVVLLKQPEPAVETLRNHQIAVAGGTDSIVYARTDQLFQPATYELVNKFGAYAFEQPSYQRLDLNTIERDPITRELSPPKLAMRAVESLSELAIKLNSFLAGDQEIVVTDLSLILYETTSKIKKKGKSQETITEVKLKPEFNVGFAALQVDANYKSVDGVKSAPVTLTLGIDLLDRNALKRLEATAPKVSLISWLEAPNVFRYATVVESGEDKGIWAGVYSNLRVVSQPNTKPS